MWLSDDFGTPEALMAGLRLLPATAEAFDWDGVEQFLVDQLVESVHAVGAGGAAGQIYAAAVTDIYAERMLILWPSIAVSADSAPASEVDRWQPCQWGWHFDATPEGDEWAGRLTALAGCPGQGFDSVGKRFLDTIATACVRATEHLVARQLYFLSTDFVAVAMNGDSGLLERSLAAERMQRCFPALFNRQVELARLRALAVEHRISVLLDTIVSAPVGDVFFGLAGDLLIEIGSAAADVVSECVQRAIARRTYPDDARLLQMLRIVAEIGAATPPVVQSLTAVLANPLASVALRAEAAATLAWVGRLDDIAEHLEALPVELALDAVTRPYAGTRKNGRLDYGPLESLLDCRPDYDAALVDRWSSRALFDIDAADLAAAMTALSSRWHAVRRHAAIVVLSAHL
ncbi:hypothetical protein [Mycolicibacter minnesotensis]